MLRVMRNHARAARGETQGYEKLATLPVPLDHASCPDQALIAAAVKAWDEALEARRDARLSQRAGLVIAPTGTIGLVMDCDTTGIEPDFALVKFKKLAGGGYLKIVNRAVPEALRALGYRESEIAEMEAYAVGHGTLSQRARRSTSRPCAPKASPTRSSASSRRPCRPPSTSNSSSTNGRSARIF